MCDRRCTRCPAWREDVPPRGTGALGSALWHPNPAHTLSSVRNAVRVLKSFSSTEREWGVTELARKLDLGKPTTHRLLATLVEEGMLEQNDETGRYRLGLAVFDLAAAVPTQHDLHEAVLTPMTALRNRTGQTIQVGVLDGREVVYIERLDSPETSRVFSAGRSA